MHAFVKVNASFHFLFFNNTHINIYLYYTTYKKQSYSLPHEYRRIKVENALRTIKKIFFTVYIDFQAV